MRTALVLLLLSPLFLIGPTAVAGAGEPADEPDADTLAWARGVVDEQLDADLAVAELPTGRDWLNVSRPLSFDADLAGKVVILDFWCYCCINCHHVLPDLAYLERKYAGQAFAVVGVHSAKFENEKDLENIREAVLRYEIQHPVVNDADFAIWRSFGARSWPTFAVVAPDGRIVGSLSGEGHREELDALVHVLLERFEDKLDPAPLPIRLEQKSRAPAELAYPGKVLADADGKRLFIADSNHNRILEVGLDGAFRRAFGDGTRGLVDGPAAKARFFRPQGMDLHDGALWIADTENHAVRKIDLATGVVSTVAGTGEQGRLRQGSHPAKTAALSSPWDVIWAKGRMYIAIAGTHQLWVYNPEIDEVGRFAGDGSERRLDASDLTRAALAQPSDLAFDGKWLYVADSESSAILRVGLAGPVETIAGASDNPRDLFHFGDEDGKGRGRRFQHPLGVEVVDGLLYVADSYNHKIKTLDPETGEAKTLCGTGSPGFDDAAQTFSEPSGIARLGRTLFVADTNNHAIRTIDLESGAVATLKLTGVPLPQAAIRSGGRSAVWPSMPGTERVRAGAVKLASDRPTNLVVELSLPEGWKLTPDSPSAVRVEGLSAPIDAAVASTSTLLALPKLAVGRHALTVRLVYYVCQDEGVCRLRSVDLDLSVEAGPDHDTQAAVGDTFTP